MPNEKMLYRVVTRSAPMDYRGTGSRHVIIHTTDWNNALSVFNRAADECKNPEYGTVLIEVVELDVEDARFERAAEIEWRYKNGGWVQEIKYD